MVNDSAWHITALNGFPGAYMSYVNKWFNAEDFLRLMGDKENREVILKEVVCFIDSFEHKFFIHELNGVVLTEAKGDGVASDTVISLLSSGASIAACKNAGIKASDARSLWEDFGIWYKSSRLS